MSISGETGKLLIIVGQFQRLFTESIPVLVHVLNVYVLTKGKEKHFFMFPMCVAS